MNRSTLINAAIAAFVSLVVVIIFSVVLGFAPDPSPDPEPPRPSPDPQPEQPFGIEEDVYKAACTVHSKHRADECRQLSASCANVARKADGGDYGSCQEVCDAMVAEMRRMPRSWYPVFLKMQDRLKEFSSKGMLNTQHRWAVLLREVKAGLDRAANETGVTDASDP